MSTVGRNEVRMTILVDQARWPWRDTLWCHLVSDDNLAELHEFAGRLGARRVGFQGDHYDIDIDTRELAIHAGATPLDSRELIRRMRAAGLRLRPSSFTKWQLVDRSDSAERSRGAGSMPDAILGDPVLSQYVERADGWFVLGRERVDGEQCRGAVVVGSGVEDLRDGGLEMPTEDEETGLFCRVDHEGNWSVERISPPPTDRE